MAERCTPAEAARLLCCAEEVLILCHKNPDGDTLGAAAALQHGLSALRKNARVFCADPIPDRYGYMDIQLYDPSFTPRYIVAVDVAAPHLFGEEGLGFAQRCDLCIDHHPSNTGYAKYLCLDQEASATCELMERLLPELGVEITPHIANCLYTGIATDTGSFKFGNTTAAAHIAAARLMEQGADSQKLNALLFESQSKALIALQRMALATLEYHFEGRCALLTLTREMIDSSGAGSADLDGITAIPRSIEGVQVGVVLRQQKTGGYKVSLRSTDAVDASAICAKFGGGGHKQAAGCEVFGDREHVQQAILAEVAKAL